MKNLLSIVFVLTVINSVSAQWLSVKEQRSNLLGLEIIKGRFIGNPINTSDPIVKSAKGKTEDIEGVKKGFETGITGLNFSFGKFDSVRVNGVKIDYIDWKEVVSLAQNRTIVYKAIRADSIVMIHKKNLKAKVSPKELLSAVLTDTLSKIFPFLDKAKIIVKDSSLEYSKIIIKDPSVYYKFQAITIDRVDTDFLRSFGAAIPKKGTSGVGPKVQVTEAGSPDFTLSLNKRLENFPVFDDNSKGPNINLLLTKRNNILTLICETKNQSFCKQNEIENCEIEIQSRKIDDEKLEFIIDKEYLGKVSYKNKEYWIFLSLKGETIDKNTILFTNTSLNGGVPQYETFLYYPKVKYKFYNGRVKE